MFEPLVLPRECANRWTGSRLLQESPHGYSRARLVAPAFRAVVILLAGVAAVWLSGRAQAEEGAAAEQYNVLPAAQREAGQGVLHAYLLEKVAEAEARRRERYEATKSPEELAEYQKRIRDFFMAQLGELPERTPLNPQITGRIDRDGYTVEKVIYESRPNHRVTALFYLPDGEPPFPGVLVPCGHSHNGKASEAYQRVSILLALNGFAVLCYDPIDQGERMQLLDDSNNPVLAGVRGHCQLGVGSILLGANTASFRVWDGFRSMDYLASREEVDADRLGCTGNSGGGTMTSYLMALDPRIKAAAPSCYLSTLPKVIETIGPQDAEQNIFAQLGFGMDHADYVLARAPKPTLLCCATRDFFDIEGTWDTFRQAKRFYTRMDFAERVDLIETDQTHGFTTQLRVGAVRWMRRWLLGIDDAITEPDSPVLSDDQCLCTPDGQVMLLPGERNAYEINQDLADQYRRQREAAIEAEGTDWLLDRVREVTGIRTPQRIGEIKSETVGTIAGDGYQVKKLILHAEPGLPLPALLLQPSQPSGGAVLWLVPKGKADAAQREDVLQRVQDGSVVLAVDLPGNGELESRDTRNYAPNLGPELTDATILYVLGRSLLAVRAEQILAAAEYLRNVVGNGEDQAEVEVVAEQGLCPPALHAVALQPEGFSRLTLYRGLRSWDDVIDTPLALYQYANVVHGALRVYDLVNLVDALEGRVDVALIEPTDARGEPLAE